MRLISRRIAKLGFYCLAITALSVAQGTGERGKQVVDEALKALGGDKFLNMHSRITSGRVYSFFRDQLNGLEIARIYTEYSDSPPGDNSLGLRERQVLGKKHDYSYLFLEKQGWDVTFRGARPVEKDTWDKYVRTTQNDILYILKVRHNESGMTYDFVGDQVYLSRHVQVIDISDNTDRTVRVYFDFNTKLPLRQSFSWYDSELKARNEEITNFDKFRDIGGGVMWPFTIERQRNGYKSFQMFADSIEVNGELPLKIFDLPPGAKGFK